MGLKKTLIKDYPYVAYFCEFHLLTPFNFNWTFVRKITSGYAQIKSWLTNFLLLRKEIHTQLKWNNFGNSNIFKYTLALPYIEKR